MQHSRERSLQPSCGDYGGVQEKLKVLFCSSDTFNIAHTHLLLLLLATLLFLWYLLHCDARADLGHHHRLVGALVKLCPVF